jgi:hypothetical protein
LEEKKKKKKKKVVVQRQGNHNNIGQVALIYDHPLVSREHRELSLAGRESAMTSGKVVLFAALKLVSASTVLAVLELLANELGEVIPDAQRHAERPLAARGARNATCSMRTWRST